MQSPIVCVQQDFSQQFLDEVYFIFIVFELIYNIKSLFKWHIVCFLHSVR